MEVPDSDEMARSFMEWTTEDVVKWLKTLSLFHDYSVNFRGKAVVYKSLHGSLTTVLV